VIDAQPTRPQQIRHVAVIGGGVSGLAAAHRLTELAPEIQFTLLEASERLGGALETIRREGFLIEGGADNFITTAPWALDLCRRIDFSEQLIQTNSNCRHAFVIRRGKLRPIPDGFVVMAPNKIWPIMTTSILSPFGKLRLACERFVRAGEIRDESVASFCRRRLGRETYERLVQPLIGGIYTGDPEKLSLRATMPRFAEMEEKHGSLSRAMSNARTPDDSSSGARYSLFVAPRDGMTSMVDAIAARLPAGSIQLNTKVAELAHTSSGWRVATADGEAFEYDAVILATPASVTARLVADTDRRLARELDGIHHTSCSIISLGFRRDQVAHPLDGFGVVAPHIENRSILSVSFSSLKYAGRAPDGSVLIRVFIGGGCQPELADLADDQLLDLATRELGELLGVRGAPQLTHVSRPGAVMPQYYVGHRDRVERIRERAGQLAGLFLAGNAFVGVGVPHCIHMGEQAAEHVVETLRGGAPRDASRNALSP
jgi:oxygen-dependent protoporphyrinogen oxidase